MEPTLSQALTAPPALPQRRPFLLPAGQSLRQATPGLTEAASPVAPQAPARPRAAARTGTGHLFSRRLASVGKLNAPAASKRSGRSRTVAPAGKPVPRAKTAQKHGVRSARPQAWILAGRSKAAGCGSKQTGNPAAPPADAPSAAAYKALQGKWEVVSVETANPKKTPPADYLKSVLVTFEGNVARATSPKEVEPLVGVFKLDADKSPKEMDLTEADDAGNQKQPAAAQKDGKPAPQPNTLRVIYKLDGDTLVVCTPQGPKGDRPAEFKAAGTEGRDSDTAVVTLRKVK
jgi:uncharacterized protein (TIGR03067 family)